jgi:hypothetical protein
LFANHWSNHFWISGADGILHVLVLQLGANYFGALFCVFFLCNAHWLLYMDALTTCGLAFQLLEHFDDG